LDAVKGLEKFAPRDYPGYVSATLFTGSCNLRCPFCHNADLVLKPQDLPNFPMEVVLNFLDSRKGWLEAVCVTGGEPLFHDDLGVLLRIIKDRDLRAKVDTNGTFPSRLEGLVKKGLIDHIAMDIKTSLDRYEEAAGIPLNTESLRRSMAVILDSGLEYTFRTTVVPGLVDEVEIKKIGLMLEGAALFQLQQFSSEGSLDPAFRKKRPYPEEKVRELGHIAESYFSEVRIEGISS